jgi:hypothetical protein
MFSLSRGRAVRAGQGARSLLSATETQETASAPPTWTKWHEIFRVIVYPLYLRKTLQIALAVGAVLFAINHLDEVIQGRATRAVWIKGAVTFLVPFCVSNLGVLVASRKRDSSRRPAT